MEKACPASCSLRAWVAGLLLGALTPGCATVQSAGGPASQPFTCHAPAPRPLPVSDQPPRRLEVVALDPAPASTDPKERLQVTHGERRVKVIAEEVPLGSLAVALSEAMGFGVAVDSPLINVRVSLASPRISLHRLLEVLREQYEIAASSTPDLLRFETWSSVEARRTERSSEELVHQIVPLFSDVPAPEVAAAICAQLLSERGTVTAVGRTLVIHETPTVLEQIKTVVFHIQEANRIHPAREP